ncbi:hypothetical protein [Arthrobacter ramosus]|uniref:hypothetical protein n=1 Tax=Arthrobacter ramosus TaxID=1672 RepID=UPI0031D365A7
MKNRPGQPRFDDLRFTENQGCKSHPNRTEKVQMPSCHTILLPKAKRFAIVSSIMFVAMTAMSTVIIALFRPWPDMLIPATIFLAVEIPLAWTAIREQQKSVARGRMNGQN